MPSKKKKYNARFPAGRIKKIMQSDEEVGKVAQAVPIIISRTLELFVESLLTKTLKITNSRNAKTLSPSHMKQCIMSENRFDFLRELVKNIPDISVADEAAAGSGNDLSCQSPGPISTSSSASSFIDNSIATTTTPMQQPYDLSINKSSDAAPVAAASSLNSGEGHNFSVASLTETNGTNTPSSTAATAEISIQNGSISINIKPSTTSSLSPPPLIPTSNTSMEFRAELKRQWDNVHACRKQHLDKNSAAAAAATAINYSKDNSSSSSSVIQHTSDASSTEGCPPPPKLARLDSLPNTNNERMSTKRLQHQSKSVPCSSKEAVFQQQLDQPLPLLTTKRKTKTSSTTISPALVPPLVPASIVSTENICNKPIVKIDYSNLALHDNDLISSSFNKKENDSDQSSTPAVNITIDPVINIDLSHITPPLLPLPSPSSSSSSLLLSSLPSSSSTISNLSSTPTQSITKSSTTTLKLNSQSSNLELDEDYDNI